MTQTKEELAAILHSDLDRFCRVFGIDRGTLVELLRAEAERREKEESG